MFVNPLDASAPLWKREWLDLEALDCSEHGCPLKAIAAGKIRRCDNFSEVLEVISENERWNRLMHERSWL